jgi:uncharacterized RDD family membrane protein YckC
MAQMNSDSTTATDSVVFYPRLIRRIRAMLIDTLIVILLLFAWMLALPYFPEGNVVLKVGILLLALFVLEPLLVALTGGTPGHHVMGIRVRDASMKTNLGIVRATVRAIVKGVLGWLSFILVLVTARHQAIHDYVTSSIVVLKNAQDLPAYDRLQARREDTQVYEYPSRLRRLAVVVLYNIVGVILLTLAINSALSNSCMFDEQCTTLETIVSNAITLLWLGWIATSIVLGWRGMLYGCRRKSRGLEP